MSQPSEQATNKMAPHNRPVPASRNPSAARMNTVTTNALEIGFQSEMPCEIPLMRTNRKHSPTATDK